MVQDDLIEDEICYIGSAAVGKCCCDSMLSCIVNYNGHPLITGTRHKGRFYNIESNLHEWHNRRYLAPLAEVSCLNMQAHDAVEPWPKYPSAIAVIRACHTQMTSSGHIMEPMHNVRAKAHRHH